MITKHFCQSLKKGRMSCALKISEEFLLLEWACIVIVLCQMICAVEKTLTFVQKKWINLAFPSGKNDLSL